eukprot:3598188-Amphidinium_carterae.1
MCGDSKSIAANTLSGIQHFVPACRRHIAASWRLYSAWGRTELPVVGVGLRWPTKKESPWVRLPCGDAGPTRARPQYTSTRDFPSLLN